MRSFVLCCALVAQFAGISYSQSSADIIPTDQRQHDFGAVAKSSKSEHRFVIHNPYKTEMRISSVRASCGCTTPILESQIVKPGESVGLLAHFNTDRFTGDKKATLTVSIAQPMFTELQLNVKGYIRSDVVVAPGEAAFGSLPESSDKSLTLTLDYAGRSDWQILGIACPYEFIKADFKEVSRGNGRVRYAIEVQLQPGAPEGHLENQLVVQTNDRRLKSFPIALTASLEKSLKASPSSFALDSVKPNEPIEKRLTMTSKSEFKILEVRSDVAEISCDLPDSANRVHMLNLVITPQPTESVIGKVSGTLQVVTDASTDKPVEIPLTFTVETEKLVGAN